MIRLRGKKYHYQFVIGGKLYSGPCEGCTTKREAEAYEKHQRELIADFAKAESVDRLMERRRKELTGRAGIALTAAFDESLKKPHRRAASTRVVEQKRSIWKDFCSFIAAKHSDVTELAAVTSSHAEEYIALIRASGRFQKAATYQRGKSAVTTTTILRVPPPPAPQRCFRRSAPRFSAC